MPRLGHPSHRSHVIGFHGTKHTWGERKNVIVTLEAMAIGHKTAAVEKSHFEKQPLLIGRITLPEGVSFETRNSMGYINESNITEVGLTK